MAVPQIYRGDCLDVMNIIEDRSIDMVLADLPYGMTRCYWDSLIDLSKLWAQYRRVIKHNGAIVLFAQSPFDKVLGASNLEMLRYEWIWEKTSATGHLNAKKMPMKAHENILVFYNNLPTYNAQKTLGHKRKFSAAQHKVNCLESSVYNKGQKLTTYDSTERYPRSIIKFKTDKQKESLLATQKPVKLCEYLIATYTNEGETVLDNSAGSGTTGIAAMNLNRKSILIEKDQINFDIMKQRIFNHS